MRSRVALVLAAVLWFGGTIQAESEVDRGAAAAIRAHKAGDTQEFERIRDRVGSDPWLVVERLIKLEEPDVAKALAEMVGDRLKDYVSWRSDNPPSPEVVAALTARDAPKVDRKAWLQKYVPLLEKEGRGVRWVRFLGRVAQATYSVKGPGAALDLYKRAADEALAIGWSAAAIRMLGYGSTAARTSGQDDVALDLTQQRIDLAIASGRNGWHVSTLCDAAEVHRRLGRYERARELAKQAQKLSRTPTEIRDSLQKRIVIENVFGNQHYVSRELPKLRAMYLASGHKLNVAACDLQLASTAAFLGRFARALTLVSDALAYYDKHATPMQRYRAHCSTARILLLMRDANRALHHIEEARKARNNRSGTQDLLLEVAALSYLDRIDEAIDASKRMLPHLRPNLARPIVIANINLACLLVYADRAKEAEPYVVAARARIEELANQAIESDLLASESVVFHAVGKCDQAIEAATRAQEINDRLMMHQRSASNAVTLTRCWLTKGDPVRAMTHATNAIEFVLKPSAALPERLGAQYRSTLRGTFEYALLAAIRAGDIAKFFYFAEQAAAVSLRNRLDTSDTVHALKPELQARELELQEAETSAIAAYRLAVTSGDQVSRKARFTSIGKVRDELDRHRERVRAEQLAGQVLDPAVDNLASTQARLAADQAFVILAQGAVGLYALWVTTDKTDAVLLGNREEVAALLDDPSLEDDSAPWKDPLAALRKTFAEPIPLPATIKRITVVPTGRFAHLPFSAIWPDRSVRLAPSATIDRLLAARDAQVGKGVLAVGDPASADGRRLPGAREEAKAVGDEVLLGEDASEARLETAIASRKRWRAVHIACHGLIDPVHPLRSALSLAPADKRDGLWTVSEILQASVSTDLVVLGACSTGRGKTFDQEGALGFVQAFFVAGAKRVLVSLWDVDDKATSAFLQHFHEAWKRGVSPAEALTRAQDHIRKDKRWTHPAYWAAWQLWGPE